MFRRSCSIAGRQLRHRTQICGTPLYAYNTFSTTSKVLNRAMDTTRPKASDTIPYDVFQLMPETDKVGAEEALFEAGVKQVKQWFASSRYEGIKRPYTAEDVVSKRGALHQTYPSSLMARKLFNLFNERAAQGLPVHTSEISCLSCS